AAAQPKTILRNALASQLPARVADAVLQSLGIDARVALAHLAKEVRRRLLTALLAWPLPIRESRGYAHAEVTAGGVPLDEIDPATMQSRRCPGLYLVGEILDVDGRIGGFNFQWAWASGYVAGEGAKSL
ncbi:MAG: NAD(P)/FAD-dependent oxidoreductase, partial [Phycisphaerae bacterium]|nr:NAD(P)/FAD-dependent oxidoreductase [Phycisphaerae bacterium]